MKLKSRSAISFAFTLCCLFCSDIAGWQVSELDSSTAHDKQDLTSPLLGIFKSWSKPQATVGRPFPEPSFEMQQYMDQLLAYWKDASSQVQSYQYEFTRWQIDPQRCSWRYPESGQLAAYAVSKGKITFAREARARYEVTSKYKFAGPPGHAADTPRYEQVPEEKERFIFDANRLCEFDFVNKRLYELTFDSGINAVDTIPFPFAFLSSRVAKLHSRFWFRDVTDEGVENEYWLEAWPKNTDDASLCKKVQIVLTRGPALAKSVHIYPRTYDEKSNPAKIVYEFKERKTNHARIIECHFAEHASKPKLL